MHLKVIACEIATREICHCAAKSINTINVSFFTQGLHRNSANCREELQRQIDAVTAEKYEALLLGYGLCNNSVVGLRAGALPLVLPRAHDCITFFLGSRERYAEEFAAHPGTYYFTSGWIEHPDENDAQSAYNQRSGTERHLKLKELIEKYGEENGQFLFESMTEWESHYERAALIRFPFSDHLNLPAKVREICAERKWQFAEIDGRLDLLQSWLDGPWDAERFLVVQPGQSIVAKYDDKIIDAK